MALSMTCLSYRVLRPIFRFAPISSKYERAVDLPTPRYTVASVIDRRRLEADSCGAEIGSFLTTILFPPLKYDRFSNDQILIFDF